MHLSGLLSRILANAVVMVTLVFLFNNYLIFWLDWPGALTFLAHKGWLSLEPLATPLEAPCNCGCGVDFCDVQHRVRDFLRAELRKANMPGRNSTGCDGVRRAPNNKQRKRCYRALEIKVYLNKFRAPLPHCVVAAVRTIWPSANGVYMGYKGR